MTDSCASCFFSRTMTFTQANPGGAAPTTYSARACARDAPSPSIDNPNAAIGVWPQVDDAFWCGEGADDSTGQSFASNVYGLPASSLPAGPWDVYTPTLAVGTGSLTSASATGSWFQNGSIVYVNIIITITTNGTAATSLSATLPTANAAATALAALNTTDKLGLAAWTNTSVASVFKPDGTYPGADGKTLVISGSYEAAS